MNLIHEYALLVAIATAVAVIVAMNVWLALNGERDTLLLPAPRAYPGMAFPEADSSPSRADASPAVQPTYAEPLREAA